MGESGAARGVHEGEGVRVGERLRRDTRVPTLRLVEIALDHSFRMRRDSQPPGRGRHSKQRSECRRGRLRGRLSRGEGGKLRRLPGAMATYPSATRGEDTGDEP